MHRPHRPWQTPAWLRTKWCYVYGGIGKKSSTMSFCHRVKLSILTSTPLFLMMRLKQAIKENRPELVNRKGLVFHHDNARPHRMVMHPPYSPDLAPSDFYLFRSSQNSLGSMMLTSKEHCEHYLLDIFNQKSQNFYTNGIMVLPTR